MAKNPNDKNDMVENAVVETVDRAQILAVARQHEYVTLEHLLVALLERDEIKSLLENLTPPVSNMELLAELNVNLASPGYPIINTNQPKPTEHLQAVIARAVAFSRMSSRGKATLTDILLHLTEMPAEDSFAVTLLEQYGVTPLVLKTFLSHGKPKKKQQIGDNGQEFGAPAQPINTREEAEAYVEQYAANLNKQALDSKIDPLIGRETEIEQVVQILARRTKNNGILVGEPGVGKTAIAEGLALKIIRKEVPKVIENSTVYSLDIGSLLAGTRFRGDFEERMKLLLSALDLIPDTILFIDEIHTVLGAGSSSQSSLDVSNLLKPALSKGSLRCVGSTTLEEYRKHFEKDRALNRRFKRIDINEPSIEDSKLILRGLRTYYEKYHGVKYSDAALDAAVNLTNRYVTTSYLPDKAIDIMDSAGARQRIAPIETKKKKIGVTEIEFEVSKVAHIPAQIVAEDEFEKISKLEENLGKSVIGQEKALVALSDAVYIARAGLREPNKPAGCYLFTGPTGVGKTEAARTLAATLGIEFLRYDMSEYMEKHSVSKLIGAPPGYVGYGEGDAGSGKLINDIDTHPHCVLLLDEIEKAHQDIYNVFLQVMDDAKLTAASGKEVNFRNVILIMTSNAGARELNVNKIGFGSNENIDADEPVIKKLFSPEFRNRLDAIVKFDRLKPEHMLLIVDKFINQLAELAGNRKVKLDVDLASRQWLAKKGYDPQMGARPLQRVIAEHIKTPLGRLMVTGKLAKKGGTARVRLVDEKLLITA